MEEDGCRNRESTRLMALRKLKDDSMARPACTVTVVAIALELIYRSGNPHSPLTQLLPRGRSAVSYATLFLDCRDVHSSLMFVVSLSLSHPWTAVCRIPFQRRSRIFLNKTAKTRKISLLFRVCSSIKRRSILYIEIAFRKYYSPSTVQAYSRTYI